MTRLKQNGEILIRALLISGIVIVMTMIVGIHSVTGSSQAAFDQGYHDGQNDCLHAFHFLLSFLVFIMSPGIAHIYGVSWLADACKVTICHFPISGAAGRMNNPSTPYNIRWVSGNCQMGLRKLSGGRNVSNKNFSIYAPLPTS